MLQIKNIFKKYQTGDLLQLALNGIDFNLRDNEFVSILGPSGSGKTTLLNIIGGLDRYDTGDLVINGISTKQYKDGDWDSYRNHTIGFVFQSYNLIPHQSILANVALALTIGGVSRSERHRRAKKVLEEVGLGDQLHKKPSQMSGGQMQRVAIARALVNDPHILLADEPTGALDSETSVQVMELLKQVAANRLVVMVTHNPELAQQYSSRIVQLRDGKVVSDSNPLTQEQETEPQHKNMGRAKMRFATALALSFTNLRTKKGRTLLTAFAGSIGIIGIALILALSTGVNSYIADIQKDTMTSYPITISAQELDMGAVMQGKNAMMGNMIDGDTPEISEPPTAVAADYTQMEMKESVNASLKENNLSAFKQYLDNPSSAIHQYLGENGVVYTYGVNFAVYAYDADQTLISSSAETNTQEKSTGGSRGFGPMSMDTMMGADNTSGAENFSQLMPGSQGAAVSQVVTDSYDLLYGTWPQAMDEVILVLDQAGAIPAQVLYQLGLITQTEYQDLSKTVENGSEPPARTWDYNTLTNHSFYMVAASDHYQQKEDGTFHTLGSTALETDQLLANSLKLNITGIIRPKKDAANASIATAVAYTAKLTDYVIAHTNQSPVVLAQEAAPDKNVLTGMQFTAPDDAQKAADASAYIRALGVTDKASLFSMILAYSTPTPGTPMGSTPTDETSLAAAMDNWLAQSPDQAVLLALYQEYIAGATYENNLKSFGKASYAAPASISLYADSFENKDAISQSITAYNKSVAAENRITYTDFVALLTGSITSIVDVISYVLIAFVAVSLVVSCIMIGIITHISVLERTKEIGILRALGASKRNISQVFNAETFIIGLCAGLLGVGVAALLTIPINAIIQLLLGATTVRASLPLGSAAILLVISMVITVIGGLLPAKRAAKKDPVIALRTE